MCRRIRAHEHIHVGGWPVPDLFTIIYVLLCLLLYIDSGFSAELLRYGGLGITATSTVIWPHFGESYENWVCAVRCTLCAVHCELSAERKWALRMGCEYGWMAMLTCSRV